MCERMPSLTQYFAEKYIKFAKGDAVPQTAAAARNEVECHTKAESEYRYMNKRKQIIVMIEMFFRSIFVPNISHFRFFFLRS